ncbi:TraM recognition domain-containing protein [Nocardia sp. NPDC050697]|uniref:type IV secretory system conjugative DNA transfer family protein n=1 Tax=Nocardia sp. NPDC050697 TaxID=3155158 RepID=UPI0033F158D5
MALLLIGAVMKWSNQGALDSDRAYYELTFPADITDKQIHAFLRSIGKNLRHGRSIKGVPTVVFETWSQADGGITHRLRVPESAAAYLAGQLPVHIPGIEVARIEDIPDIQFQDGATIHMDHPAEELSIANAIDFSAGLLGSMQDAVNEQDAVVVQWIISHSDNQKQPTRDRPLVSSRASTFQRLLGNTAAGRDELETRRNKQVDQNYMAVARVAARGKSENRARQLVTNVVRSMASEGGHANIYARRSKPEEVSRDIQLARTPFYMTAQLSVTELAALISWPMGDFYVPGMKRGSTRHMPPSESVPRLGRVLGKSTMPGLERPVAMSYEAGTMHTLIAGGNGVGKTNLMEGMVAQDIAQGCGIILIERDGNLFQKALDQVPPHRLKDVITIDFSRPDRPVGLNLLRLARPDIVAGQLAALLDALYPDNRSIYANQLVIHGIPVLANLERATIADLTALADPRTPAEKAWMRKAIAAVPDKVIRQFWEEWHRQRPDAIAKNSQPLKNRLLEILTPEPSRYLLNQETSSFEPADVITGNKLLFINLAGVSEQVASLIGTMLVTAHWREAVKVRPDIPNFMYLDEFQQFGHLSGDFEDMFATARKRNLGLVVATQYIDRLKPSTQDAVMANARTKVIFNSSVKAARVHASDFGSRHVTADTILNLKAYDAVARINTAAGVSDPLTLHTTLAPTGPNLGRQAQEQSARLYGRDIGSIIRDDESRRTVGDQPERDMPNIGWE